MAEYNHEKFYWIKLKQSLMTSKAVDFLMSQKDGANYVVLYQCLCLTTVNQNGELADRIGEIIVPFDELKIQRETKWFSIDTIRVAMSLYKQLGLIYEQSDGILCISNFEDLVGSQTISAAKKQEQIARRNGGGNEGGKKVENFPPEIEKEIEIDIKERKKENKDIILSSMCASAHTREESIFAKMTDKELVEWGENQVPDFSNPESIALLDEYREETRRRANKTWQGKIVGTDGSLKRLQSHDEIIQEWGCSPCVARKLKEFLRGCYLNGCVITNEQLNSILFELDHYDTDEDKNSVLQSAISGGYKDIKRLFTKGN